MTAEGTLVNGRYRLDQPIGRGRAGIVWLAFDTRLHRTVTAKRLYVEQASEPVLAENARATALREGTAASQVAHDCVITVHDALAEGQDVWLIMEYVPSRSMDEFLAEHGRMTPEQSAALGAQLGSALAAAHNLGLAHGALEPGNVLLADDGGVKITDFGITGPGASPAYRAPELAAGGQPNPASDVFSLGATLYTAVEGTAPFGSDGRAEQVAPQHAGVLTGTLLKLLRADPGTRPGVSETVNALTAIGSGSAATPAAPEQPSAPTPPPATPAATPGITQHDPASSQQATASAPPSQPQQHTAPQPTQQQPAQQQPTQAKSSPRRWRTPSMSPRAWAAAVIAVIAAIAVGIVFAEIVLI